MKQLFLHPALSTLELHEALTGLYTMSSTLQSLSCKWVLLPEDIAGRILEQVHPGYPSNIPVKEAGAV